MNHQPRGNESAPPVEELREMVAHTREELGRTVDAPAAKAAVKAQAMEKAADLKEQAVAKAAVVTDQLRESAVHAARLAKDKIPDPAVDKAAQAAAQLHATAARAGRLAAERTPDPVADKAGQWAAAARAHRMPLVVAAGALGALLLVLRSRRHR
ncbi:DUF3618 domain-containing protein [Streptomyces zaomyceticus]|uniref:DUF3618 domain-containing protein n=1 Tax=Streptomyces zaomyceticus TaxID=68286 RepID=A0ABZ1LNP9_9ACTN|nr:DUF3618 domain-containing protein [Streptomyces zaomyceticus]